MTLDDVEEAIERLETVGFPKEAAVMRCLMEEIAWMRVAVEMIGDTVEAAFDRKSAQFAKLPTSQTTGGLINGQAENQQARLHGHAGAS